jgi:phosphotransferase system  glucose/maltose/N-acetylglucosamine-specific IIC component
MPQFFKNKVVAGIVYGLLIWAVMNLIVVPLSRIGSRPFTAMNMIIEMLIIILCIGIPLSFMANSFYKKQNTSAGNHK